MKEINTDQHFLEELKQGSPNAFEALYTRYFRMVEDLVIKRNGSREEAKDIFQEALVVLVKKVREPDFSLTGKISTYLFAISRNIFLKKIGKAGQEVSVDQQHFSMMNLSDSRTGDFSPEEKESLFNIVSAKLNELEEDCRNIIMYAFYRNLSHSQIAELTGYSISFIKVKKFRCLEYLRRLVKPTDIFKNI